MGKITRRDLLKTGAMALSGAGFLVAAARPTEAHTRVDAKPSTREETVLEIDVLPWKLVPHSLAKYLPRMIPAPAGWTLVLTLHEGMSEPPRYPAVRSRKQRIVAIRGFTTRMSRQQIMNCLLLRYASVDEKLGWPQIADRMIEVIEQNEHRLGYEL